MEPPNTSLETDTGTSAGTDFDVDSLVARTETFARQEPMKAVSVAFIAGLIFTLLPIGTVVAGLLRLVFALIRPALLVLGAMKLYEEVDRRQNH